MPDDDDPKPRLNRREVAAFALEAARVEVCQRLRAKSLPTSSLFPRLVVVDGPDGNSWSSRWEQTARSSLNAPEIAFAVHDDSVPTKMLGLRPQLYQLAELLARTTHLGEAQAVGLLPGVSGPDAALARYVQPFAYEYLLSLRDLAEPEAELRDRLLAELDELCARPTRLRFRRQFALSGLVPHEPLGPFRGVTLRPLTGVERGRIASEQQRMWDREHTPDSDFVPARPFWPFDPRCLLETVTERDRTQYVDSSELPAKVLLALYLSGFDVGSNGSYAAFDEPRWASFGVSSTPFPIAERILTENEPIGRDQFEAVVRLAHKIPDFGAGEASSRAVALYRVLRGCSTSESGFLDFAIALEAALLSGATSELAYRFSLYGSLFLSDDRDPATTFAQLKQVYQVRSKLVHGTRIDAAARQAAETIAADLGKAVIRKAVERGWPNPATLDRLALGK